MWKVALIAFMKRLADATARVIARRLNRKDGAK